MAFIKFSGHKVRAKDVVFKDGQTLTSHTWNYVGYINGNQYKNFTVDTTNWNEAMIVVGQDGVDNSNRRALITTVIPRDVFAIGYAAQGEGRHQAKYSDSIRGGLDFTSKTQVRLYAGSGALCRLYYR